MGKLFSDTLFNGILIREILLLEYLWEEHFLVTNLFLWESLLANSYD